MTRRRIVTWPAYGGISVAAGLAVAAAATGPHFLVFLAFGLLAASTVGAVAWSVRRGNDALSVLSLSAVFYLLAFGAGGLYAWFEPAAGPPIERNDILAAMVVANVGWAAFAVGYMSTPLRFLLRVAPALPAPPFGLTAARTLVPLLVVGWLARVILVGSGRYFHTDPRGGAASSGTSWLVTLGSLLPMVAIGILATVALRRGASDVVRALFLALVAAEVGWLVPTGARSGLIQLALLLLTVAYYVRERFPWAATLTAVGLSVLILFPLGLSYRDEDRSYVSDPVRALNRAFSETLNRSPSEIAANGADATLRRFTDVTSVAAIARNPHAEPLGGESYQSLLWAGESFIPRLVLPAKTDTGRVGTEFGRQFGFSCGEACRTSIAITQLGEVLLNFGIWGVILGMPLVGAAYRVINDYFGARRRSPLVLVVYATFVGPLVIGHETILALGLVGVFKTAVVLWLLLGLLAAAQARLPRDRVLRPDLATRL